MRLTRWLAPLALAASPALADDPRFGGFASDVVSGRFASETRPIDGLAVTAITIGDLQIFLEWTEMTEVVAMLGGRINEEGEAGGHVVWSCYGLRDATLWAYSDGEMGEGKVTGVMLEAGAPAGEWGCTPLDMPASDVELATPSLGYAARELSTDYGAFTVDEDGRVGFSAEQPLLDGTDAITSQWLVFRLQGGRVDAVGITEETSD